MLRDGTGRLERRVGLLREVGEEVVERERCCGLLELGTGAYRGGNLDIVIRLFSSVHMLEEFDIVAMDSIC